MLNAPISLTPGIAFFIGQAFTQWLQSRRPPSSSSSSSSSSPVRVSLGCDPRISGPMLEAALVVGLAAGGAEVDTFGIATTPCMFYSIVATGETLGGGMRLVRQQRFDGTYSTPYRRASSSSPPPTHMHTHRAL